jgi:hypothetical protein
LSPKRGSRPIFSHDRKKEKRKGQLQAFMLECADSSPISGGFSGNPKAIRQTPLAFSE